MRSCFVVSTAVPIPGYLDTVNDVVHRLFDGKHTLQTLRMPYVGLRFKTQRPELLVTWWKEQLITTTRCIILFINQQQQLSLSDQSAGTQTHETSRLSVIIVLNSAHVITCVCCNASRYKFTISELPQGRVYSVQRRRWFPLVYLQRMRVYSLGHAHCERHFNQSSAIKSSSFSYHRQSWECVLWAATCQLV